MVHRFVKMHYICTVSYKKTDDDNKTGGYGLEGTAA